MLPGLRMEVGQEADGCGIIGNPRDPCVGTVQYLDCSGGHMNLHRGYNCINLNTHTHTRARAKWHRCGLPACHMILVFCKGYHYGILGKV